MLLCNFEEYWLPESERAVLPSLYTHKAFVLVKEDPSHTKVTLTYIVFLEVNWNQKCLVTKYLLCSSGEKKKTAYRFEKT